MSLPVRALTFPRERWTRLLLADGAKIAGLAGVSLIGGGLGVVGASWLWMGGFSPSGLNPGLILLPLGVVLVLGCPAALPRLVVQMRRDWLRGRSSLAWDGGSLTLVQLPIPPRWGDRRPWWSTLVTRRMDRKRVVGLGRTFINTPVKEPALGGLVLYRTQDLFWLDAVRDDGTIAREVLDERLPCDRVLAAFERLAADWALPFASICAFHRPAALSGRAPRPRRETAADPAAWRPSHFRADAVPLAAEVVGPPPAEPPPFVPAADDNPYASPRGGITDATTWQRRAALAICPASTFAHRGSWVAWIAAAGAFLIAVAALVALQLMAGDDDPRRGDLYWLPAMAAVAGMASVILLLVGWSGRPLVSLHAAGIVAPNGSRLEWGQVTQLIWVWPPQRDGRPATPTPGNDPPGGPPILVIPAIGPGGLSLSCPPGSRQRAFARMLWEDVAPPHLARTVCASFASEAEALTFGVKSRGAAAGDPDHPPTAAPVAP